MTTRCLDVVPLLGPLLDGALPSDDREWVQDHLLGCEKCRDRQALIAAQGQAIREVIGERAAAASFEGFADRVLARVSSEPPREVPGYLRVWTSEMWGAHRGAFAASAGVMAAACLAMVALFGPRQSHDESTLLADASGPQIEEVEFGTHDGAVLQLPRDTTVIWMSDDKAVQE